MGDYRSHRNACLNDGMQPILAVAHTSLIVELDGFARKLPFTALNGSGHGLDATAEAFP